MRRSHYQKGYSITEYALLLFITFTMSLGLYKMFSAAITLRVIKIVEAISGEKLSEQDKEKARNSLNNGLDFLDNKDSSL